ncbi:MAG: DoxX family membrane protein [Desulfobacterales bacterium]|nr:DoxX family membrane protein [Desulfobacterales bacterium]
MNALVVVGRVLYGGLMVYAGISNFLHLKMMAELTKMKGMPLPTLSVAIASAILISGGLSILANYRIKIGVLLIWIFLVPVTLIIHNFWTVEDPMVRGNEMAHFLKNLLALAGALIFLALPASSFYAARKVDGRATPKG